MPQTKTGKRKHRKITFRGFRVFDLANWFAFTESQWAAKILNVVVLHQYGWIWHVFHYVSYSILMQNEDIWNFHGSLTLNKGKGISGSLGISLHQIWLIFFILFKRRKKLPVLDYLFHLYWRKMETFGIFTAHWLWTKANRFDILETFSMPLCQIWLNFIMMPYFLCYR